MSEFTDKTLSRYLDAFQTRRAYHLDPQVHADVERMRMLVDAAERAMADEGVPVQTQRRVINRVVFGDPEGLEPVHLQRLEQIRSLAERAMPTADVWPR